MPIRKTLTLLAAAALALTLAAAAVAASIGTIKLKPNEAGKRTRITLDLTPSAAGSPEKLRTIVVSAARGFKVDRKSVAKLCNSQQASSYQCPTESSIGGGTAHGHADGFPSGRYNFILDIQLFLAPAQKKGDLAGVVVQAKDRTSPIRAQGTGRVVPLAHGQFGVQLRLEGLDKLAGASYPGVTVAIDKAHLSAAASRLMPTKKTVKQGGKTKQVTVNVRHSLLTNPQRCKTGSWPFRLRLHYSDGRPDQVVNSNVACTS